MEDLLRQFETLRVVFEQEGIRFEEGFALPRQHALFHYVRSIRLFGSPNGLCSSITESKHIAAVKEPWRESNRRNPLSQIIRKITRKAKLAAARVEYGRRNMLYGDVLTYVRLLAGLFVDSDSSGSSDNSDDSEAADDVRFRELADAVEAEEGQGVEGVVDLSDTPGTPTITSHLTAIHGSQADIPANFPAYVRSVAQVSTILGDQVRFVERLRRFLQMELDPEGPDPDQVDIDQCPYVWAGERISIYHSASATFYAPSELSGPHGMHREMIRAAPLWWGEYPRYDTVLVKTDPDAIGIDAMTAARVRCFFMYKHDGVTHKCALVEWFVLDADEPDPLTGMWIVRPELDNEGNRVMDVIAVNSIVRACHLIAVYGTTPVPDFFHFSDSLDAFSRYYINWYVDYHAHETIA